MRGNRDEFPRRFNLTPRCVVRDLAEVEAWACLSTNTTSTALNGQACHHAGAMRKNALQTHARLNRASRTANPSAIAPIAAPTQPTTGSPWPRPIGSPASSGASVRPA